MNRVLHVVGNRWWSAITAYAIDLASTQMREGVEVSVAVLRDSPAAREAARRGIRVAIEFDQGGLGQTNLIGQLIRTLRSTCCDVVHVHTGTGHLPAELARRVARRPILLVRTRGDIRSPRATPTNRWLYRTTDAVVLTARMLEPGFAGFGLTEGQMTVVPAGIDVDRFRPDQLPARVACREALAVDPDVFLMGLVARLSPVKGHRYAIEALAGLTDLDPPVHLLIAGEEFQVKRDELRELARTLGVADRLHFRDRDDDVRNVLAALDIGLVTSIGSEAICRICAEMMACKLPVVSARTGVLPEMVVAGETGFLVPARDSSALSAAVRKLHQDPESRAAMARRTRVRAVATFSLEHMEARYREIYEQADARRRATHA